MSHPLQAKVERARWWRDHLRTRCRPQPVFVSNRRVLVAEIQARVAEYYRIDIADMLSGSHEPHIVRPKQVAMFLARRITQRSYPWLAGKFGGMHHSTVMHSVNKIQDLMVADEDLRDNIDALARIIVNGP